MFGPLGVPEMLFILVLALLVFGPRRLPELGRTIGRAMGEFRRATTDLRRTLNNELALEDEAPRRPAPAPSPRPRPRPVGDGSAIVPSMAAGSAPREAGEAGASGADEASLGAAAGAAAPETAPAEAPETRSAASEPATSEPAMPEPPPDPTEPR